MPPKSGQIQVPSAMRWLQRNLIQTMARLLPQRYGGRVTRPCFLIGCPRSGTSFLDQVLSTHPQVCSYPSEALDLWHPNAFPWRVAARRFDFPPIWANAAAYTDFSLSHRTHRDDRHLAAAFGVLAPKDPTRRFVQKCTLIGMMLPHVLSLFPDSQFVHVIRDGRAVALSWAKRQLLEMKKDPEVFRLRGFGVDRTTLLRLCATAWRDIVRQIDFDAQRLGLGEDRLLSVQYESFCDAPDDVLHGIAEFLGVDPSQFDPTKWSRAGSQNYKFTQELSEEEYGGILDVIGDTLHAQGYVLELQP